MAVSVVSRGVVVVVRRHVVVVVVVVVGVVVVVVVVVIVVESSSGSGECGWEGGGMRRGDLSENRPAVVSHVTITSGKEGQ